MSRRRGSSSERAKGARAGAQADSAGPRTLLERDFVAAYEAAVARGVSNHSPLA